MASSHGLCLTRAFPIFPTRPLLAPKAPVPLHRLRVETQNPPVSLWLLSTTHPYSLWDQHTTLEASPTGLTWLSENLSQGRRFSMSHSRCTFTRCGQALHPPPLLQPSGAQLLWHISSAGLALSALDPAVSTSHFLGSVHPLTSVHSPSAHQAGHAHQVPHRTCHIMGRGSWLLTCQLREK